MGVSVEEQYDNNGFLDHVYLRPLDQVRLLKGNPGTFNADSVVADLDAHEADFSGYSAGTPSDVTGTDTDDHYYEYDHSEIIFAHNGGGTSNTIYGWYVTGDGLIDEADLPDGDVNNELLFFEIFGAPITMEEAGDEIRVKIQQRYQGVDS